MPKWLATGLRPAGSPGMSSLAWKRLGVIFLCVWVALAPALAEARAGSSSRSMSQGSRGSRTYEYDGGQSFGRSMTPRPASPEFGSRPATPYGTPSPGYNSGYGGYGGGFSQRHPFMTGVFGGFLGAGLAGMLFGHGGGGWEGGSPIGSFFGLLFQLLLIGGIAWFVLSLFRGRRNLMPMPAGNSLGYDRNTYSSGGYGNTAGAIPAPASRNPVEIPIGDADFNAWSDLLTRIQEAWTRGDLSAMRRYVTPEMLSYFAEELAANASRDLVNKVEDVHLLNGDLQEAWREGDIDYATARLRWSALDYMARATPGGQEVIVSGDASRPVEATELWTFLRSRGGHWLLSAIQQV